MNPFVFLIMFQTEGGGAATSTEPAKQPEVRETIAEKVAKLQTRKTEVASQMNSATEGPAKVALQDELAIIERKLRWYAGRSEGKGKAAARPTKPAKASKSRKQASSPEPAPATPPAPAQPDANAS